MKNVEYKMSVRIKNETLRMINYIIGNSNIKKSELIREVLEPNIRKYYEQVQRLQSR
jgi:predicted ATPase